MSMRWPRPWLPGSGCLICLLLSASYSDYGCGTDFCGGTVTGKLVDMMFSGTIVFVAALAVTVFSARLAGLLALAASLLDLPLYSYLVAPGVFQKAIGGPWLAPSPTLFDWEPWAVFALLALLATNVLYGLQWRATGTPWRRS